MKTHILCLGFVSILTILLLSNYQLLNNSKPKNTPHSYATRGFDSTDFNV